LSADVRSVGDESIRIIPIQNYLNIKGTVKGDLVEVYSLNGIKLKSVVAIGDESMIELNNGQIVLVKIRNKTYKVIL
jgi:sRNA-binding regulator protein Hfq